MKLGIIGAMAVEIATLKENMENMKETTRTGMVFYEGRLQGVDAVVVQCGIGKVNAAMCTQILCDCFGVTHVVNTGIAGSLCAELDIGDLVISCDAIHHDGTNYYLYRTYKDGVSDYQKDRLKEKIYEGTATRASANVSYFTSSICATYLPTN